MNKRLICGLVGITIFTIYMEIKFYEFYHEESSKSDVEQFEIKVMKKILKVDYFKLQSEKPVKSKIKTFNNNYIMMIMTKNRQQLLPVYHYFHLTFKSALKISWNLNIPLTICDLNDQHNSEYLSNLSLFKEVKVYFKDYKPIIDIDVVNRETLDYLWCLRTLTKQFPNISNYIMLEDDIELDSARFSNVVPYFIKYLKHDYMIKFYHPPRLLGYIQPEYSRICEMVALSVILYYFFHFLVYLYDRQIFKKLCLPTYRLGIFIISLNFVTLLSRLPILELRKLSTAFHVLSPAPFCCTPAMLYSHSVAHILGTEDNFVFYKKLYKTYAIKAIDQIVYELAYNSSSLDFRYLEPNLVHHFGHVSSLRDHVIDPRIL